MTSGAESEIQASTAAPRNNGPLPATLVQTINFTVTQPTKPAPFDVLHE